MKYRFTTILATVSLIPLAAFTLWLILGVLFGGDAHFPMELLGGKAGATINPGKAEINLLPIGLATFGIACVYSLALHVILTYPDLNWDKEPEEQFLKKRKSQKMWMIGVATFLAIYAIFVACVASDGGGTRALKRKEILMERLKHNSARLVEK